MSKPTLDLGSAVAAIEEAATTEGARTKISKAGYTSFMESRGLTSAVITQHANAHRELYGAAALVAGAKLKTDIEAAIERGDDPSSLRHTVDVNTQSGAIIAEVSARSISSNPRATTPADAKIIRHGATTLKVRVKSQIPTEAITQNHSLIGAAMEGVAIAASEDAD